MVCDEFGDTGIGVVDECSTQILGEAGTAGGKGSDLGRARGCQATKFSLGGAFDAGDSRAQVEARAGSEVEQKVQRNFGILGDGSTHLDAAVLGQYPQCIDTGSGVLGDCGADEVDVIVSEAGEQVRREVCACGDGGPV